MKTISSIKRNFVREKLFYMTLLKVGIPIALQNMLGYFVNLADTIMLGKADNTGLLMSASSLANQPFFIMAMVCFGLSGAAAVLNTQYYGKGDFDAIRSVFAIILRASAVISVVFGAAVLLFPTQIMTLYSADPKTVATGAVYLSVMGWAYIFYAITSVMLLVLRSVAVTKISVWVSLASLITNVIGNWILIFGNLGFPAMGIKGAALATLFARAVEFIIVSVYVFKFEKKLSFRITDIFRRSRVLSKDLLKYGTPVLANEVLWSLAMTAQASILGHITYSTGDPVAANAICSTVQQISTLFVWGVAHAGAVLVGGAVGERDTEKVIIRSQTLRYISYI
ncbi:MAG: MATE family efflux transporter, partial [Eubacteriales bacterium]